jgi:two-component system response regulator YesN
LKALIVDDEKHVRKAITLLVDWETLGIDEVYEASNGQEAIAFIEEMQPEFIFTDMMMPMLGGIELLEWIHANAPESKTMVISGHNDFNFVRHTLKFGGMDYILKPIDEGELNQAVKKAVESWKEDETKRKQNRNRNMEINQIKPVYWEKTFSNLISQPESFHHIKHELNREFKDTLKESKPCQIAILSLDTMEQTVKNKFSAHKDLLFFSLTNICNELLRIEQLGYAFRHWNHENEMVIFSWGTAEAFSHFIPRLRSALYTTLGGKFDFGMGLSHPIPLGIKQSYKEAYKALRHRNLLEKQDSGIHYYDEKTKTNNITLHFSNYEGDLRLAIRSGNDQKIEAAVRTIIDDVRKLEYISIEQVELWWHEYQALRSKWLKEWFNDQDIELTSIQDLNSGSIPLDQHGRISIDRWMTELTNHMIQVSKRMLEKDVKDHNIVYDIARYIEENYAHDITLQDIASHFYLSREYISRKFKQELNENISDYIGRIRMDKAKLLLLNPHLKMVQISEMIGYNDEKYFSKVFKKIVGCSPNEYRKKQ